MESSNRFYRCRYLPPRRLQDPAEMQRILEPLLLSSDGSYASGGTLKHRGRNKRKYHEDTFRVAGGGRPARVGRDRVGSKPDSDEQGKVGSARDLGSKHLRAIRAALA
jgi:hypothetical protein